MYARVITITTRPKLGVDSRKIILFMERRESQPKK